MPSRFEIAMVASIRGRLQNVTTLQPSKSGRKARPNLLPGWRRRPNHNSRRPLRSQTLRPKIKLVIPFHRGHLKETIDVLRTAALQAMSGCDFVLDDIAALKLARSVHRKIPAKVQQVEPVAEPAQRVDRAPDQNHHPFTNRARLRAQFAKHLRQILAMFPFFIFDFFDCDALVAFYRKRMATISIGGCSFAGMGILQESDQLSLRHALDNHTFSESYRHFSLRKALDHGKVGANPNLLARPYRYKATVPNGRALPFWGFFVRGKMSKTSQLGGSPCKKNRNETITSVELGLEQKRP